MATYSKSASNKVAQAMHEKKEGTLKTGSGKKVTSKAQAIAIGLSEARDSGAKVPSKKSAAKRGSTKGAAKKSAAKKGATKKGSAKKTATKKGSTKGRSKSTSKK